jgi:hypothetical protein
VITLATPHHGTVFARLGLGRNARQMRPGSDFLRELDTVPEPVPITCIAASDDNLIVPRSSPLLPGAAAIRIERVGHLALLGNERALQAVLVCLGQGAHPPGNAPTRPE